MKALIAENDPAIRVLLETYLSRFGECHALSQSMAAVEVFTQALASDAPYDLVLMAAHMPAMDGTEAVRQIRAMEKAQGIPRARGVHILMLTSVADAAGVARSPQEAYDGYLLKPVDLGDLLGHLRFFGFAG